MSSRLELAHVLALLVALAPGCADAHNRSAPPDGASGLASDAGLVAPDAWTPPTSPDAGWHSVPALCSVANATETRMPLFLFADQSFAATVTASTGECLCTPRIPDVLPSDSLRLELCACCEACDCAGGSYEASIDGVALPVGTTQLSIPHGRASVVVVPRGTDHTVPVTGLRVVGPDLGRTRGGPALWWVEVRGTDALCCLPPMPLVDHSVTAGSTIGLAVTSNAQDPCDCVGRPVPFTAWHSLGTLSPGGYTVSAGGLTASFTVPLGP